MLSEILSRYGFEKSSVTVETFGTGLINHTWKINKDNTSYILQRINDKVFKTPEDIRFNINLIAVHFKKYHPDYLFIAPIKTLEGQAMLHLEEHGYFRMFPFVPDSHSIDVVATAEQAFEAAAQFGRFTRLLEGVDMQALKITIPDFHDISLRYQQFLVAIKQGNPNRMKDSKQLIDQLLTMSSIVKEYDEILENNAFKKRVTHHDTKISNVLFDASHKGLCVIDLDTVMPGYFISDVGDMMRTYLSPVSEEEKDFSKIVIRESFYKAIVNGYYSEMKDVLTDMEKQSFFYAGCFMIYMQAIRFLTDHLQDDQYYGARYPGHNFVRAGNQAVLLQALLDKKEVLSDVLSSR